MVSVDFELVVHTNKLPAVRRSTFILPDWWSILHGCVAVDTYIGSRCTVNTID
jgi:hypothetical protein